ncbi:hypothetical protein [Georgenia subflava]|uniref:Uncharacterized protein n=1 Tax=Georgenia subflava TaxID=1622177 RepID=A0A6N7EKF8_9MICO|nr:hypothetical protein [Georgenia subflava]MPV37533.1 hypothetical protein [Georgenia subflava]
MDRSRRGSGDRLLPATRALLVLFAALTLLAVAVLLVRAEETATTFAWTIEPPATAGFMGAGYASGTVLVVLSLAGRSWTRTRVPLVTILAFTALTLVATVVHLDKFHLRAADPLPRLAAWFWLAVYVIVPVGLAVVLILQRRVSPVRRSALRAAVPMWLKALLLVEGAVLLVVGTAIYLAPTTAEVLWPWTLTPLTARSVGAWLVAYGVAAGMLVRADDLALLRTPAVAYTVFGTLQLVVLGRFAPDVSWDAPSALVVMGMATAVAATGIAAFVTADARVPFTRGALRS